MAKTATILVVDDDPVQRRLLQAAIGRMGHAVALAEGGAQALEFLARPQGPAVGAVVLDLVMESVDGLAVLAAMAERGIGVPAIVQTAQGGIEVVVNAMRAGAFDFVVKPVSPERLRAAIDGALKLGATRAASVRAAPAAAAKPAFRDILAESPGMERVLRIAAKAARSDIPVLIEGESGVGKELVARAIQAASDRKRRPFVAVNCGALPENLVESILFGHEKGAFTGASERHVGKFEEASGGTLFLDEIGELPADIQVKLLRAIQESEIDPVGARRPVSIDIRIISATNRNLIEEVKAGRFREDLYYRLSVLPVTIPPLRERREDIPVLAAHFAARFGERGGNAPKRIAPDAMAALVGHDWPGNIRELENAVFRAAVLSDSDVLSLSDFPQIAAQLPGFTLPEPALRDLAAEAPGLFDEPLPSGPAQGVEPGDGWLALLDSFGQVRRLEEIEAEAIRHAIRRYEGHMSEVARRLGIGRSTLYRKLKDYGIEAREPEGANPEDAGSA
jgi:DNA-binding NtrC family response regulator